MSIRTDDSLTCKKTISLGSSGWYTLRLPQRRLDVAKRGTRRGAERTLALQSQPPRPANGTRLGLVSNFLSPPGREGLVSNFLSRPGREQRARCSREGRRDIRQGEMREAGKALPHAAVRRATTTQLPLEGAHMQPSLCSEHRFCFETVFRQLRASTHEKKIETDTRKREKEHPTFSMPTPFPRSSKLPAAACDVRRQRGCRCQRPN